ANKHRLSQLSLGNCDMQSDSRMFFFSSRRRHTRSKRDWSSDVCSSDLCDVFTICLVTIAKRSHLFPCRTQKLSSLAPMAVGLTSRESRTLPGKYKNYIYKWRISSAERASAVQADGRRIEAVIRHHVGGLAQLVEQLTCNQ